MRAAAAVQIVRRGGEKSEQTGELEVKISRK
jgi:hypothetical protein